MQRSCSLKSRALFSFQFFITITNFQIAYIFIFTFQMPWKSPGMLHSCNYKNCKCESQFFKDSPEKVLKNKTNWFSKTEFSKYYNMIYFCVSISVITIKIEKMKILPTPN